MALFEPDKVGKRRGEIQERADEKKREMTRKKAKEREGGILKCAQLI